MASYNSLKHSVRSSETMFYCAKRVPAWQAGNYDEKKTDILLNFINKNSLDSDQTGWWLQADVLMTNGDSLEPLSMLPILPVLQFAEGNQETVKRIECLQPFTPVKRPFMQPGACWRYISHLSSNYLVCSANEKIEALRAMLAIYNFDQQPSFQKLLTGLQKITCQQKTARSLDADSKYKIVLMTGFEINLQIDESAFQSISLLLFGSVLEHFFTIFVTRQFYTRLIFKKADNTLFFAWQARLSKEFLL